MICTGSAMYCRKRRFFALNPIVFLPKSKTAAESSMIAANSGRPNTGSKQQQSKLTSTFSARLKPFTTPQSPLHGKSRSSTPSDTRAPSAPQSSSSSGSSNSLSGMKPLRPYGTTASPHEVANAAKMLKRIEDMKGEFNKRKIL